MRGTLHHAKCDGVLVGIIPAHAGNTSIRQSQSQWLKDHPRACGEHAYSSLKRTAKAGSSPRMRGTRVLFVEEDGQSGIIPAHAGNTRPSRLSTRRSRDHPRACGEHSATYRDASNLTGSSPRMRGTHVFDKLALRVSGIIPAHAGNTFAAIPLSVSPGDHPRACGEHVVAPAHHAHVLGSSPRMRGTHLRIVSIAAIAIAEDGFYIYLFSGGEAGKN